MEIKKSEFITTLANASDYKSLRVPEIAVAGRSNVGKSTFINMLAKNSKLARTSSTPGKTRNINIFMFNDTFALMDLPGYGYARVGYDEKDRWGELIEGYLKNSENLKHVILLLDIRHAPSENDQLMIKWLYRYNIPFSIVATKADTLPKSKLSIQLNMLSVACGIIKEAIIPVSSVTKQGKDQVLRLLSECLR